MKVLDFGMGGKTEQDGIPTPENQVEIVNAGVYNEATGRYEHKCCVGNRNLLKITNREIVTDIASNSTVVLTGNQLFIGASASNYFYDHYILEYAIGENSVTLLSYGSGYGLGFDVAVKEGQTYTINMDANPYSDSRIDVAFYDNNGNYLLYYGNVSTFTIPANASWALIVFRSTPNVKVTYSNIQLEWGSSTTDYTPHASQPFTLTSDRPLTMWDKLVKRDGVWGWSIWQLKFLIKSLPNSVVMSDDFKGCYFQLDNLPKSLYRDGYCNQLINDMNVNDKRPNIMWLGRNNDVLYIVNIGFYDESLEDRGLANLNTHLAENPLEIITYSDTEQAFIPLPEEEQTLLHNLETYYGVTNVYNEQGCPMWLTYISDPKLYVDQKLLQIQQAMI